MFGPMLERVDGGVQPYIPLGPFQLRLPFIHYRFELPDYIQGLMMCAVCLGIIPVLQEYLGMPFEIAITIVILNGFLYLWHSHLGDPVVPGWITPAIPLLLLWLKTYPEGVERMHALIAFEFELGVVALVLGSAGLAQKFVALVPDALKAGILLGAGVAAVRLVFDASGNYFAKYPWTIGISIGFAFYILFSNHFKSIRNNNVVFRYLSDLGLLPALVLAVFVAPLVGELPWPHLQWGFTVPQFGALFTEWNSFLGEDRLPGAVDVLGRIAAGDGDLHRPVRRIDPSRRLDRRGCSGPRRRECSLRREPQQHHLRDAQHHHVDVWSRLLDVRAIVGGDASRHLRALQARP